MKIRLTVFSLVMAGTMWAQQGDAPPTGSLSNSNPITLATEFFEKNNFLNYYAFANAVYDTYNPTLDSNGQRSNSGGVGYQVGGGISARHVWRKSVLTVNYAGDYRDYTSSFFGSGTDQNLGLGYNIQLNRRWNMSVGVGAGTILYGTGYFGQEAIGSGNIQLNPFSNSTRFVSSYVNLSYQQTRRLSYTMSGGFYLQRYSFPTAVGSTGGSGGFAVNYRITSRTTISANYGRSYFVFQRGAGTSAVDSYYGSVSHRFSHNWIASASGGISRSHVTGFVVSPLTISTANGETLNGFVVGPYDSIAMLPSFSGALTRLLKRSSFSVSGGQNIVSGNGYYLASKNQFLNGFYSRSYRRSNVSAGGYWNRLNSVANSVAFAYTTSGFSGSYSFMVRKYIGFNGRYDFLRYGALQPNPAIADNRFSFGVTFTSANIPLALY